MGRKAKGIVMASTKKRNKIKNAFLVGSAIKNKGGRCKRLLFYTPSQRKVLKEKLTH